jgi:hypothetical protein
MVGVVVRPHNFGTNLEYLYLSFFVFWFVSWCLMSRWCVVCPVKMKLHKIKRELILNHQNKYFQEVKTKKLGKAQFPFVVF